jgi:phenylalanyl-tRNA synthetase beta chain
VVSPGIRVVSGLADAAAPMRPPVVIRLPLEWLRRKLGREIESSEVRSILEALEFGISELSEALSVTVPSWRATKDISIKDDLVEEVGRMIGYGSIQPVSPLLPAIVPHQSELREFVHDTRKLVAAQGFHEVYNYSFLSDETAAKFGLNSQNPIRVLNPIAVDQALMRTTLVSGTWKNIVDNSRFFDEFRLFEIGREIHRDNEPHHLAAAVYRKEGDAEALFEAKRLAECIAPTVEFHSCEARAYEHPARTAEARIEGRVVGQLFEFHPNWVKGRAAVLDLDLDALLHLCRRDKTYQPLRRFPSSSFDLSVIAGARTPVGDIERQLRQFSGDSLEAIEFVRQYSGPPLPEGTKSVSYRVTVAAPDRTLSSDEVGAVRSRIIDGMRQLGYDLRV